MNWIRNAILLALALPTIPLVLAWREFLRRRPAGLTTTALGILTASYVWMIALLVAAPTVAPDYSSLRSHTIGFNCIAVIVALFLGLIGRQMRGKLSAAGLLLLALWAYIGLVSVVV